MSDTAVKRALVTGASSGIGAAFARLLSERGYEVVLVGRDPGHLGSVAADLPGPSHVLVADLTHEHGLAAVEMVLRDSAAPVDLLVNNAAAGTYGPFAAHDPDLLTSTVALNVTAVIRLSQAVLTSMLPRRSGGVITMSSLAGASPQRDMATYSATKAFIDSWTASVHQELRGSGVTLTCVRPGWVRSEFHSRAGQAVDHVMDSDWLSPKEVATRALDAHARGRASVAILPELPPLRRAVRGLRMIRAAVSFIVDLV